MTRIRFALLWLMLAGVVLAPTAAAAPSMSDYSSVPPIVGFQGGAAPNILFTFDMSSSMSRLASEKINSGKGTIGKGGPGWRIKGEIQTKSHAHIRGAVAMASDHDKSSAGSQFFIALIPLPYLMVAIRSSGGSSRAWSMSMPCARASGSRPRGC